MDIIFLLGFLETFLIFILISINFLKHYKNKKMSEIINYLSLIGLFYLVISLFSLLWFFNYFIYNTSDFIFIYSLLIVLQTLFLFRILYIFTENKRLFYFSLLYLIVLGLFFYTSFSLPTIILFNSFIFLTILFVIFSFRSKIHKKIGYYGIIYSLISLFFQVLLIFNIGEIYWFSFFSNFFFMIFLLNFINGLKKYPINNFNKKRKKRSHFFIFFRYFVFMVTLISFIFIGTVGIHEFGHYAVSKFFNCQYTKIVYEDNFPYTETLCRYSNVNNLLLLGGIILPLIIAIFLFFIGGTFLHEISLLIVGFDFLVAYKDLLDLGVSDNINFMIIIFGLLFLITGIFILAKSITENYIEKILQF
jgi:hypothetical protein